MFANCCCYYSARFSSVAFFLVTVSTVNIYGFLHSLEKVKDEWLVYFELHTICHNYLEKKAKYLLLMKVFI